MGEVDRGNVDSRGGAGAVDSLTLRQQSQAVDAGRASVRGLVAEKTASGVFAALAMLRLQYAREEKVIFGCSLLQAVIGSAYQCLLPRIQ